MRNLSLVLALFGIFSLLSIACGSPPPAPPSTPTPLGESPPTPPRAESDIVEDTNSSGSDVSQSGIGRQIDVILADPAGSGEYSFSPGTLNFEVGETIDFNLIGETEFHTFTVEELGIDEAVGANETAQFSFTFDQAGTYTIICIPHSNLGMVGEIVVGPSTGNDNNAADASTMEEEPGDAMSSGPSSITVNLSDPGGSGEYAYIPDTLSFSVGESVQFTLVGESEFHTFTVEGLGIDEIVDAGEVVLFSFTFDKPGTYKLICIPHEANGMVGEILVQ